MATKKKTLVTKAKEILIGAWTDESEVAPTEGDALDWVIADTLTVSQDDPDSTEFEFETTDTKEVSYTQGDINVDLNNASIDDDYLEKIMGWIEVTINDKIKGYINPSSYSQRYVSLQIKFSDTFYIYIPKLSIAPKVVFESIKTNLAYGSLTGVASNYTMQAVVGSGSSKEDVTFSMGVFHSAVMTKAA